jgi:hypothetical protein
LKSVPSFLDQNPEKKSQALYTRKKRQSSLIFSFIRVLECIKKTNLEVGLGCYCWYWSVEVITEAFCTYTANFWMLYYWIVLATHRKEVSDVLIRPWMLRCLFIGCWKLIYLDFLVCAGAGLKKVRFCFLGYFCRNR